MESAAVDNITRSIEDTTPRDSDVESFAESSVSLSSAAACDENLNGESEYSGKLGDESGRDSGNTSSSCDELFIAQEEDISYMYNYVSAGTSFRKCSKCFYMYLNIHPMQYSAKQIQV